MHFKNKRKGGKRRHGRSSKTLSLTQYRPLVRLKEKRSFEGEMPRSLANRTRFVVRRKKKSSLPWLRHKVLQLQLWTAAYMLDSWEAAVILSLPVLILV